ncbi:MAG: hypothetical protein KatS3mg015_2900 [Fimbriimonadales bacterium]|nr:MAG: hypothetical protein KatS3mg015_2900 [Fimbriimonadales bacterium]
MCRRLYLVTVRRANSSAGDWRDALLRTMYALGQLAETRADVTYVVGRSRTQLCAWLVCTDATVTADMLIAALDTTTAATVTVTPCGASDEID